MPLPVLNTPKYTTTLPSNGKNIEYRPFLVKEEKILLIAQESKDQKQIIQAMKDIIESCTFGQVNINILPTFDVEYLFLKIRAKSVGELATFSLECDGCQSKNKLEVNLDDIEVTGVKKKKSAKDANRLQLNKDVGVNLKYPMFSEAITMYGTVENANQGQIMHEVIASCIESIFDTENVYYLKDCSPTEIEAFVNSMSHKNLEDIMEFMNSAPKISKTVEYDCKKCGKKHAQTFEGLQAFFQ